MSVQQYPITTAGGDYRRVEEPDSNRIEDLLRENKRKTCLCTAMTVLLVLVTAAFIVFAVVTSAHHDRHANDGDGDEEHETNPVYCQRTQSCWPTSSQISTLITALPNSTVVQPGVGSTTLNASYRMKNPYVQTYPAIIAYVQSTQDVVECIRFVKRHNLRLTILSSGHSYTGRSSANDSFQINFSQWKSIVFLPSKTNPNAVVVTTGNTWGEIYNATDQVGRIIIGGSAQTVTPGGYTQGGGHSPFAPLHGLAVDNVLEFEVVTANGMIRKVSNTSYPDLFWALRGGGGGTFAVVTRITFRIHVPPPKWTQAYISFNKSMAMTHGVAILDFYHSFAMRLDGRWGGYILPSSFGLSFSLLFAGPIGEATTILAPFSNFHPEWQAGKGITEFNTFYEYEKNVQDTLYVKSSIFNVLINETASNNTKYSQAIFEFILVAGTAFPGVGFASCTATHVGRKVSSVPVDSTAVSYGFRNARYSLSCGIAWFAPVDAKAQSYAEFFGKRFDAFANASYFSETNAQTINWTDRFWGESKFEKLEEIKEKYDPGNVFFCSQCVGDERRE